MPAIYLSAAHKSSGKTTLAVGLCAALRERGLAVQPYKKGPDYIDPLWLSLAAGRPCHNLDPWVSSATELQNSYQCHLPEQGVAIIEGNKGLYDGLDLDGSNSNASVASQLDVPVILVIDARGMTRGIAPLLLGYQAFDRTVRIAGVILNQVGGKRHEAKLRAVIEHYTDIPVVGAVWNDPALLIEERHLGLIPSNEASAALDRIRTIGRVVSAQVDLVKLLEIAESARVPVTERPVTEILTDPPATDPPVARPARPDSSQDRRLRIGIARDQAFGFYYAGDLEALEAEGVTLVPFNTLTDSGLPEVDALFIGGGFPESHMERLSANHSLRATLHAAIEAGLPVYAECGGLMYLARSIRWQDRQYDMVGALPLDIVMEDRPVGRGYVRMRETRDHPWPTGITGENREIRAHEFHYSRAENIGPGLRYAYEVLRGHGLDGQHDGIVYRNVLASYTHLRHLPSQPWVTRFLARLRQTQDQKRHPSFNQETTS